jgi:HD superfamily phosphodiesterase
MTLLTKLFHFVIITCKNHNIDESHGLSHSMNVLNYAHEIYNSEIKNKPFLEQHRRVIYTAAILHDMCDKKYMDEMEGITEINKYLQEDMTPIELDITKKIITTMSYSKVKRDGFPELGEFQDAYHIVREADLLTAYDFDRCMIYNMHRKNGNIMEAYNEATELFCNRVLKHNDDKLFLTEYSKQLSQVLHYDSLSRMNTWKNMVRMQLL